MVPDGKLEPGHAPDALLVGDNNSRLAELIDRNCPVTFRLRPVAPFRLDFTVWALRRRPENVMDRWDGTTYHRVVAAKKAPIELAVRQVGPVDAPEVLVSVRGTGSPEDLNRQAITALERLLGLRVDLTRFYGLAAEEPLLGELTRHFWGLKPPCFSTPFEALVNAVACQQITLTQGIRLLNRVAEAYGPSGSEGSLTTYALPGPADFAALDPEALRPLGFSRQKARAIVEAGQAIVAGRLDLAETARLDDAAAVSRLREIRGVGRWTAEYVLLRGLGRVHVFPGDDVGARKHLQYWLGLSSTLDYASVRATVANWHPYAGLIYFHLLLKRLAEHGNLASDDL